METKIQTLAAEKTADSGSINILMVDDRPENLLTLSTIIDREGRNLIKANSGNEALKIALQQPLGLILMDVQMPGMDGFETAQILRSNPKTKHIPILFVSAVTRSEKVSLKQFEEGTVDYIYKPLEVEETRNKIAAYEMFYFKSKTAERFEVALKKISEQFEKFVYIVSHDFKSPMRAALSLVEWIGEDLRNSENQNVKDNMAMLEKRINRMQAMFDGLLEYSRAARMHEPPEAVHLNKLTEAVIETLMPPKEFTFEVNLPDKQIMTERNKLFQVLTHVIKNTYMHHHAGTGKIKISCTEEDAKISFCIEDDGPGINPESHLMIFDVFHTLVPKDKKETTGMGLPIAKKIVESYGGTIHVESDGKTGTKVYFTWPV